MTLPEHHYLLNLMHDATRPLRDRIRAARTILRVYGNTLPPATPHIAKLRMGRFVLFDLKSVEVEGNA